MYLLKSVSLVNENNKTICDILIKNGRFEKIDNTVSVPYKIEEINAEKLIALPGAIDDQVHFREPGLTHKATIETESRAAIAGGVTSYMDMPNTNPPALTQELLAQKYEIARHTSAANYSFYMGTSNDNYDEVMRTDPKIICGIKIFMGSSTGNLLVDSEPILEKIFSYSPTLIATHCEDEKTILRNIELYKSQYGDTIPAHLHPSIRTHEACILSSQKAITIARKHKTRLHLLHITTLQEAQLLADIKKQSIDHITTEACVHHIWFDENAYSTLYHKIKCNPAIKSKADKEAIRQAIIDDTIDVIATDHAPHTWEEKQQNYWSAPSGLPLVQHSYLMMLDLYKEGIFPIEKIVEKMAHKPADIFRIKERGYVREGYHADLVLLNSNKSHKVTNTNIHYKCAWSPLTDHTFSHTIDATL